MNKHLNEELGIFWGCLLGAQELCNALSGANFDDLAGMACCNATASATNAAGVMGVTAAIDMAGLKFFSNVTNLTFWSAAPGLALSKGGGG